MESIRYGFRIFDCMDVSISLNLLVSLSFPPTSVAFLGTFHANPVAPRWATANDGATETIGDIFIALIGHNLYCTLPRQLNIALTPL